MTFQTLKDVANYCHTFFEIIATDAEPVYCGMTLKIPGFPSTLVPTKTDKDKRDCIVQWIVAGLNNWPEVTNTQ